MKDPPPGGGRGEELVQIQRGKDKNPSRKIRNDRNRLLTEEGIQVALNDVKLSPASLVIREMQMKTRAGQHLATPSDWGEK